MADRTWITMTSPTPLIFRYHLPLSYPKKAVAIFFSIFQKKAYIALLFSVPVMMLWSGNFKIRNIATMFYNKELLKPIWEESSHYM